MTILHFMAKRDGGECIVFVDVDGMASEDVGDYCPPDYELSGVYEATITSHTAPVTMLPFETSMMSAS